MNNIGKIKGMPIRKDAETVTPQRYIFAFIASFLIPAGVIYALWFHEPTILSGHLMYFSRADIVVGSIAVSLSGLLVGARLFILLALRE